uniref:Uncharacterized protein n=1 Tax=uncultured marine virus TaxID=186617 RepID=A0A0F7L3S4_9VIRU|nr:hypothetical protein [uncultured marine virus]
MTPTSASSLNCPRSTTGKRPSSRSLCCQQSDRLGPIRSQPWPEPRATSPQSSKPRASLAPHPRHRMRWMSSRPPHGPRFTPC